MVHACHHPVLLLGGRFQFKIVYKLVGGPPKIPEIPLVLTLTPLNFCDVLEHPSGLSISLGFPKSPLKCNTATIAHHGQVGAGGRVRDQTAHFVRCVASIIRFFTGMLITF